ncbi:MAG: acyl-CoA reductase [Lachnospiraceae bacterium]|nr:acyl-CoA reductase [Lachnospiraceae bacterium]
MILYKGKLYETSQQARLLGRMEKDINDTRARKRLDISKVIGAVDMIGQKLEAGIYKEKIAQLGIEAMEEQIRTVVAMANRESIEYRLEVELGELKGPFLNGQAIKGRQGSGMDAVDTYIYPLGTLFHIAAGNREGLPVFSVLEGLLTGNINILKLPQADQGLSIEILQELLEIEPSLAEFLYVFDTPSTDLDAMCAMAGMSDGIVVWGGDEAVAAVRRFAPAGVRLIEWGHKLSFAYLSGLDEIEEEILDEELRALAEHIVSTRQVLCSSCQVIYLDQSSLEGVKDFCNRFLPYLEQAALKFPAKSAGMRAEISMKCYCETLQKIIAGEELTERQLFAGRNCSLTACEDMELELSEMLGNCLVKCLPSEMMMDVLRRNKGYLQTAGLLCPQNKRRELTERMADCGVARVTSVGKMSDSFFGEAHDGEYPLRRYVRTVNVEVC